jgi:peptide/nickel transport system substrate-binding protein
MAGKLFTRRQTLQTMGAGALALGSGITPAFAQGASSPLTASILGNLAHAHPWQMSNHDLGAVKMLLYSNLVYTGPDATIEPEVAVSMPTVTNDGLTYTFELRDDVYFHSGAKLTADDVIYTWEKFLETGMRRGNFNPFIKEVVKENEYQVRFELSQPWSGWLLYLTKYQAIIQNGTDIESLWDGDHGAGSGPFTMTSFETDVAADFEAFPDYFLGSRRQQKIRIMRIPDSSTQLANLQSGSVDIISTCPPKDFAPTLATPGYTGAMIPSAGIFIFPFNRNKAPFDKLHARKAIAHAIDRDFICNELYYGLVTPSALPAAPGEYWYDEDLAAEAAFDLDKAKWHLEQAGMPNGFSFEAMVPAPSAYIEVSEAAIFMQAMLAEIGIDMQIKQLEFSMVLSERALLNHQASPFASMQPSIEDYLMSTWYMCQFNGPDSQPCDAEYDKAISDAYRHLEPELRRPHLHRAMKHLIDNAISVYIGRLNTYHLWRDNVQGFAPSYMYSMDFRNAYKT